MNKLLTNINHKLSYAKSNTFFLVKTKHPNPQFFFKPWVTGTY